MAIYKGTNKVINIKKTLLPSTYQQVEYIESSGTQYINTGVAPSLSSDELKVVMKYATTTSTFTNTDNMLFGSGTPTNSDCCYFVDATRNKHLYVRYYNNSGSTTRSDFFTTYPSGVMVLNSNGLSVNGSTPITTSTSGSTSNDLPIYIFARNGTTTLNSAFKLYYFKMEKNGTLVRDFIPCYRKSDDVIGLYDLVNGVFYTNQGTGDFTKGSNVIPNVKMALKGSDFIYTKLPSGYQKCEYIESSGTQYIDSGIVSSTSIRTIINFEYTQFNSNYNRLFGTSSVSGSQYGCRSSSSSSGTYYFELPNSNSLTTNVNVVVNQKTLLDFNNNSVVSFDRTQVGTITITPTETGSQNIWVCGQNPRNTELSQIKLFSCKIYDNTKLVRYFIPCYRTSDSVIGLYDIVGGNFYTNSGTGTFTKGSDI